MSTGLRREIQGLRAIAALFRLWPQHLSGGYIGVDIFFVISGFLITAHLLREVELSGRVALGRFWARRVRRLLPASFLVIAVSAVGTWLWVPQSLWPQFVREIIASTIYVENWQLARDSVDYLAQDNAASPVQHYWTLSAEEQFYLVWPLLVLGAVWLAVRAGWMRRAAIFVTLATVTAASLTYSLYLTAADPALAYFITPTRAWEFGAGALLACAPALRLGAVVRTIAGSLSIAILVACAFVFDESTPMPGLAAVVVVTATVCFLATGGSATPWSPVRVLESAPAGWTGDISYALYLWHWPLIILLPYARGQESGTLTLWAILIATFVLSYLSTRYVENPIRGASSLRRRVPLTFVLAGSATIAIIVPSAAILVDTQRQAELSAAAIEEVADAAPDCFGAAARDPEVPCENPALDDLLVPDPRSAREDGAIGVECASREPDEPVIPCEFGDWDDPDALHVVMVGDSHARMWNDPLVELVETHGIAVRTYVQSGCVWTLAEPHATSFGPECVAFKEKLRDIFERDADQYDLVLTTGRDSALVGTEDEITAKLRGAWEWALDAGVPVVAIADIPENDNTLDQCLEEHGTSDSSLCAFSRADGLREPDPFIVAAAAGPGTASVDFTDVLCDETDCFAAIGGAVVYTNSNHYTATFARTLAPQLWRSIERLGVEP